MKSCKVISVGLQQLQGAFSKAALKASVTAPSAGHNLVSPGGLPAISSTGRLRTAGAPVKGRSDTPRQPGSASSKVQQFHMQHNQGFIAQKSVEQSGSRTAQTDRQSYLLEGRDADRVEEILSDVAKLKPGSQQSITLNGSHHMRLQQLEQFFQLALEALGDGGTVSVTFAHGKDSNYVDVIGCLPLGEAQPHGDVSLLFPNGDKDKYSTEKYGVFQTAARGVDEHIEINWHKGPPIVTATFIKQQSSLLAQ